MIQEKQNKPEYIADTLEGKYSMGETRNFLLNLDYSARTLINGRKWLFYVIITMLPVLFSLLARDRYFGLGGPTEAFVDSGLDTILFFLFTFGALFIALPHTADEISDNVMESYVVRPTSRYSIYLSRSIVSILGIFVCNTFILLFYYLYFHLIGGFDFNEFFGDLDILGGLIFIFIFASMVYGSLFTFVGIIGNRGFVLGVILALFESFFLSVLFLANNTYIPRTHLSNLADRFLKGFFTYERLPEGLELIDSFFYLILLTVAVNVLGMLYFKQKQFDG